MQNLRRARLLGPDDGAGSGLEIGALHAPLLKKPDFAVLYVDYAPTEVVRANQFDPAIDPNAIVEVDIVWGSAPLREAVGRAVDYVVASHVIEHVPDLIGWLLELHQALRPGGTLGLAVPDKRFTFDALRQDSTLAEAVEAYLAGYRRPSLRQVFDVAARGIAVDAGAAWAGRLDAAAARAEIFERIPGAFRLAQALHRSPRYNDAHCWVFTPRSFLDLIEEFAVLGLFPFRVEAFHPTERGAIEFQVRLVALAQGDEGEALASIRAARADLVHAAAPGEPVHHAQPADQPANETLAEESRRLRAEVEALRASTSWRVTAPLRALSGLLKRRPRRVD